jgi:ribosomal protein S18 acetylase RimI-like enzyme
LNLSFSTRRSSKAILNPNISRLASYRGSEASMSIRIVEADLNVSEHRDAVLAMVDAYSRDTMGSAKPLDPDVRLRMIPGLQRHPTTLIFLAFEGEQPVGVAVCFIGFSTFAAKPLINIHDCMVLPAFRGKGVGRRLLDAVEAKARELGCCKLTLEVMDNNDRALRAYEAAGFVRYALQENAGTAIFLSKPLH